MLTKRSNVWSMDRQVRLAAGALVLAGLGLARIAHPWFRAVTAYVGAGLMVSAFTRKCGLTSLLGRLPFNAIQRTPGGRIE